MNPGKLNKRILIQKRVCEVDENGFEVEFWQDVKTVWANMKNLNGRELIEAQGNNSKVTKKAIIRYTKCLDNSINPKVSLDYRIMYKNNPYNLIYPDNLKEENKYIELLLEEI